MMAMDALVSNIQSRTPFFLFDTNVDVWASPTGACCSAPDIIVILDTFAVALIKYGHALGRVRQGS